MSARAALVYLALPEFNTPERELTVLGEKESRLRRIEGAEAVLISLLDRVSGQLFLARRYRDAQLKFEEALQLRAAHYGAGSFEEAVGLLHMSQFYGGLAREKGGERGDVELSITYAQRAVASYLDLHEVSDPRFLEISEQVEAQYRDLGLTASETEVLVESLPRSDRPF